MRTRRPSNKRKLTQQRKGKIKYALFAWLLGLPIPIILIALFFRGCDF